jgi:hypothetical protein
MVVQFQIILSDGRVAWEEEREMKDENDFQEHFLEFTEFANFQPDLIPKKIGAGVRTFLIHPNNEKTEKKLSKWRETIAGILFQEELHESKI